MNITLKLLLFLFLFVHTNCSECRDQENRIVDWFIAYKLPSLKNTIENIEDGLSYIYMTPNDKHWMFSNISINSTNSIIGNTLEILYTNEKNVSYIMYNDEKPNGKTSSTKGHTKGVVTASVEGGFWLIHSVPRFPELSKQYVFPSTGAVYGQSFLCISMNLRNMNQVGLQLQYNEPNIYAQNIQPNIKSLVPNLVDAAANVTVKSAPWYNLMTLVSKKNTEFLSFAKSNKFNKELYVDLVAPFIGGDLDVETWCKGTGILPSNCTQKFHVNNIKSVTMEVAHNITFFSTNDHSKWAVSSPKSAKSWACVGDINRAEHQEVRGGGTVCIEDEKITNSFQQLIGTVEAC